MGMGTVGGKRGRRGGVMADINVTPLVDVMLVLLIIFMVAAPMMTQGLEVDLPEATTRALPQSETPLVVTINKDGELYLRRIKWQPPPCLRNSKVCRKSRKKNLSISMLTKTFRTAWLCRP